MEEASDSSPLRSKRSIKVPPSPPRKQCNRRLPKSQQDEARTASRLDPDSALVQCDEEHRKNRATGQRPSLEMIYRRNSELQGPTTEKRADR
jgi:hypothetical protein